MRPSLLLRAALPGALAAGSLFARSAVHARDLGIPIGGSAGVLDAITDVAGDGMRVAGKGPVRTGVTAVLPRDRLKQVMASYPQPAPPR